MGTTIVKPDATVDLYVEWSGNADAPVGVWDRATMLAKLEREWDRAHPECLPRPGKSPADRLARVDRTGTSALWPSPDDPAYGYTDEDDFLLNTHPGPPGARTVTRANLGRYAQLLAAGRDEEALALTEELPDLDD